MESYPRSPELSQGSDKEKSESDSKKEKKIGSKVAQTVIKRPAETRGDSLEPKNAESIWQRIAALAEKREIDKAILKPIENADADSKLNAKKDAAKAKNTAQIPESTKSQTATYKDAGSGKELQVTPFSEKVEAAETDGQESLENLSAAEKKETLRRYAESRRESLQQELREAPDGMPPPVETAADLVFLDFVEQQMAENEEQPIETVLDKAEQNTLEVIVDPAKSETGAHPQADVSEITQQEENAEHGAEADTEADVVATQENNGEPEESESGEPFPGEDPGPENPEPTEAENPDEETPLAVTPPPTTPPAAGGAGGGSGTVPPAAGSGSTGSGSGGAGGGGGGRPPIYPMPGPMPGGMPPTPGYGGVPAYAYAAPATYNVTPGYSYNLTTERRRAMVQGFLVGGIIGYLIGRRRGRIKTEKRLLPIQKKLEKQVVSLAETVALKEQAIRKQAADTVYKMKTLEERKRFADQLAEEARKRAANAEVRNKIEAQRSTPVRSELRQASERSATSLHRERQQFQAPRAERLGRLLVEAPGAAILAAGASSDRPRSIEGIDFSRRIEDYTPAELNQAAEKIRVDNVTLREIRNEHRLGDTAMRKVITAYVEGRSVREALNKELFDKDLRYERDPKYRRFETDDADAGASNRRQSGSGSSPMAESAGGGTITSAAAAAIGLATGEARSNQVGSENQAGHSTHGQKPTLSPDALAKVRRQQIAEVSVAGVILVGIVVAIVVALF